MTRFTLRGALSVALAIPACAMTLAIPAHANPVTDPCQMAVTFLCRFVPMAPELDGDVDLTTSLDPAPPAVQGSSPISGMPPAQ